MSNGAKIHSIAPVHPPADNTADRAIRYLTRTGNTDLLPILGLTVDAVAAEMSTAKALAALTPHTAAKARGVCPICGNKLPGHGVCRRSNRCREAARERGESA